ncbi:MAG: response regulator [Candidatus Pacebacteria bacterium]|jgi:DNA-binding response OmpR family regulator|nr:response regulator [Candidatus Paceibacterota bacterium]
MKKILSIEDDSSLQKTLVDFLKKQNYKVFSASDGLNGLELAKNEKPDIILLDLILPKLEGFSVLEELKSNDLTRNIPIIITTNLEQPENIEKAIEKGAAAYLVKNQYTLKELLGKIKENIK